MATNAERHIYRENLELAKTKVDKKKTEYELRDDVQLSVEGECEDLELSIIGSKKSRVFGPFSFWIEWWMMVS